MRTLAALLLLHLIAVTPGAAANWPQWRGPRANGVSPEQGLPVRWSAGESVAWKAPLGGLGVSSPIVWEDRVFLSSQLGRGVLRAGDHPTLTRGAEDSERDLGAGREGTPDAEVRFLVQAFATADGALLWEHELPAEGELPEVHGKNNLATPSCVTEGEGVYCWFGTGQLVALGLDGASRWQRSLRRDYGGYDISWGHSSSPVLYRDSLLLLADHASRAWLLALDKRSGEERWKVDRGESLRSYSTPMVVEGGERDELVVNSSEGLQAYDPMTGALLWHLEEPNRFPVPSPAFGDGTIFTSRGYRSGPYMAIEPGGRGEISKTHLRWHVATGAPYVSSVVYHRGLVFMVNDSGVALAVDGQSGETVWKERLGGIYSASPVAGDGKVYFTSEGGEVVVMRAGREPEILARNRLEDRVLASPAISNGRLYLRTDEHLIAVGPPVAADRSASR